MTRVKVRPAPARTGLQASAADELALVFVTVIWGSTFVVVGGLVERVPPSQVLVVRFAVASALLLALGGFRLPAGDAVLRRGGVVLGLWLAAGFGLQTLGLVYTTPARSGFITGFCVVLPPLIAAAAEWRRPRPREAAAALLAGLGIGLIGWPGRAGAINPGDVLTALCAFSFGMHIYLVGGYAPRTRPHALTTAQIAVAMLAFVAASGAAAGAVRLAGAGPAPGWAAAIAGRPWRWEPGIVGAIVYLALFATVVAYFLQTRSQRRVSPARAGILFALEPVFAAIISVSLHKDALTARLLAGGVLVVAGILVSTEGEGSRLEDPEVLP